MKEAYPPWEFQRPNLFCMGCSLVLCLLETPEQTPTGCWTRSTGDLKTQLAPSKPLCPHPASMPRTGKTSAPGKTPLWSLQLKVHVILIFSRKDSHLMSGLPLSCFHCPSMESALYHGKPREKEEICDLSPELKQNPISLYAVLLTITMSLVIVKSEIILYNACISNRNEWQLAESGFDSCRSRSSSVFSLSHPHPGMPHSQFFYAGWSWAFNSLHCSQNCIPLLLQALSPPCKTQLDCVDSDALNWKPFLCWPQKLSRILVPSSRQVVERWVVGITQLGAHELDCTRGLWPPAPSPPEDQSLAV